MKRWRILAGDAQGITETLNEIQQRYWDVTIAGFQSRSDHLAHDWHTLVVSYHDEATPEHTQERDNA